MELIAECRQFWRLWSVRLAALAGALTAVIVANPQLLIGLLAFVPPGWQTPAAIVTGILTFVIPTLTRVMHQPELREGGDGQ